MNREALDTTLHTGFVKFYCLDALGIDAVVGMALYAGKIRG